MFFAPRLIAAIAIMMFASGLTLGISAVNYIYKGGAIERGFAEYCPTNGKWRWKGECE